VSARAAGVPYMTLTNAHWSPYARPRVLVPELTLTKRFGPRVGQALFSLIRPLVFAQHAMALNKVRREYGLSSVGHSLSRIFTEADHTLYADLPELVPTFNLPPHHYYLGPVLWSADAKPSWWEDVPNDMPLAYVTLGSSGRIDLLPNVLDALEALGMGAIVATGGRRFAGRVPRYVWISDYIPGSQAAARSDVVICNGGSASVYQAIGAGAPVLGIPSNLDQYLMMHYVKKSGVGEMVRAGQASNVAVGEAVRRILHDTRYKTRVESLKHAMSSRRAADGFAALLDGLWKPGLDRNVREFEAPARQENGRRMPKARC
jgi:UDP:flavonoid glycosyltransferase YjiC (YdhE family)